MRPRAHNSLRGRLGDHASTLTAALRKAEGSQLLEFALVLPLLLVLLLGIFDFAAAFNIKQIMNNAAREGARIGSSQPRSDLTDPDAESVDVIHDAVVSYLKNAGVDTSFMGTKTFAGTSTFTWTYLNAKGYGLKIERNVNVTQTIGGSAVNLNATRVTLSYPYNWSFGFNNAIKLLVPAADYTGTIAINTDALMSNIN